MDTQALLRWREWHAMHGRYNPTRVCDPDDDDNGCRLRRLEPTSYLWACRRCLRTHRCRTALPAALAATEDETLDPADLCVGQTTPEGDSLCMLTGAVSTHTTVFADVQNFVEQVELRERLFEDGGGDDEDDVHRLDWGSARRVYERSQFQASARVRQHAADALSLIGSVHRGMRRQQQHLKWQEQAERHTARNRTTLGLAEEEDDGKVEDEETEQPRPPPPGRRRLRRRHGRRAGLPLRDLNFWTTHVFTASVVAGLLAFAGLTPASATALFARTSVATPMATSMVAALPRRLRLLEHERRAHVYAAPRQTVPDGWLRAAYVLFVQTLYVEAELARQLVHLLGRWYALIRCTAPRFELDALRMLAAYALVLTPKDGGVRLLDGTGVEWTIVPPLDAPEVVSMFVTVDSRDVERVIEHDLSTPVPKRRPGETFYVLVLPRNPDESLEAARRDVTPVRKFTATALRETAFKMRLRAPTTKMKPKPEILDRDYMNAPWLAEWFAAPAAGHPTLQ